VTNQAHDLDEIARKQVLMKLIDHRRQIEDLITMLMGANPEYRRFVDRYNHGSVLSVRELRNYDVPTPDPTRSSNASASHRPPTQGSPLNGSLPGWARVAVTGSF
jgi:hypothetical protein